MFLKWESFFDNHGIKLVALNDKQKKAYVPSEAQCIALAAAGITPAVARPTPPIELTVLFDPARNSVISGFYHAVRSEDAARPPEPRMGKDLISRWLEPNDEVLIGNIGAQLFVFKLASAPSDYEEIAFELSRRATRQTLATLASAAGGPPEKRLTTRTEFVRNPFVVFGALARAGGKCESRLCSKSLFMKDDGQPYLEVHHILPLSEGGDDTLDNVAALCPHCHRELHHGVNRMALRLDLKNVIAAKVLA